MKAIDTSPLTAALDAREWRTLRQYLSLIHISEPTRPY
mgnify:CR=1 FL=1